MKKRSKKIELVFSPWEANNREKEFYETQSGQSAKDGGFNASLRFADVWMAVKEIDKYGCKNTVAKIRLAKAINDAFTGCRVTTKNIKDLADDGKLRQVKDALNTIRRFCVLCGVSADYMLALSDCHNLNPSACEADLRKLCAEQQKTIADLTEKLKHANTRTRANPI